MILEIDMGNTRLKWRVRSRQATVAQGAIGVEDSLDLLFDKIDPYHSAIDALFVASVVGEPLEKRLGDWAYKRFNLLPVFARTSAICGMVRNGYHEPHMLGVDRWLAIVAAYQEINASCIVVSLGTAITVDLIASDGKHKGGFIAPGLNLMLNSLRSRARQIVVDGEFPVLRLEPAVATSDAVYSACAAMVTGLIDNGMRQLSRLDQNSEFQVLFTGGDADKLLPFYPQARLLPDLVLDGLACVLDYPQQLE
jgi:type III pantothenate kinase